jgi:beta-phosphoglucomutase
MHAARALVFDFNGTLSHDEPVLFAIYAELFAEHGRPLTEDDYFGTLAGNTEEAIIGGWLGVDGEALAALVEDRIDRYVRRADGSTIPHASREAVRHAAARVPVAVVSGAYRREITPVLEGAGLAESVSVLVAADDLGRGKPDPEGYVRALKALGDGLVPSGLAPSEVVAFEDTEAGVASARGAGMRCLAVRGTHPDERLAAAHRIVDAIDVELVRSLVG